MPAPTIPTFIVDASRRCFEAVGGEPSHRARGGQGAQCRASADGDSGAKGGGDAEGAGALEGLFFCAALRQQFSMAQTRSLPRRLAARLTGHALAFVARFITAVRAEWRGIEPIDRQRVYFANHVSNADMPMIWTVLPGHMRRKTRPVAAADYWLKTPLRAFVGPEVFNCVLVDRRPEARTEDPMRAIRAALDEGSSLIIFPEGNRNMTEAPLLPFRAGLYNIGMSHPQVDLVPTWVANLTEIMPKGEVIPLPLICTVIFGAPIHVAPGEDKEAFLARAAEALVALAPTKPDAEP
jgi:1-acyl-sn-glycerol-3-phosphate acyltransferase